MSAEANQNIVSFNDMKLELGAPLDVPDQTLVAEHSGQLVVAHELDGNGEPAQRIPGIRFAAYPVPPAQPDKNADRATKAAYEQDIQRHVGAVADYIKAGCDKTPQAVPPIIGYLDTHGDNASFFSIRKLDGPTRLLPYPREDEQRYPFHIRTAVIREKPTK